MERLKQLVNVTKYKKKLPQADVLFKEMHLLQQNSQDYLTDKAAFSVLLDSVEKGENPSKVTKLAEKKGTINASVTKL